MLKEAKPKYAPICACRHKTVCPAKSSVNKAFLKYFERIKCNTLKVEKKNKKEVCITKKNTNFANSGEMAEWSIAAVLKTVVP